MQRLRIAVFLFALWPACVSGQLAAPQPAQTAAQPQGTYPDSRAGLQHFLEDLFAAIKSNDKPKIEELWQTTVLPDHAKWFANVFGEEAGAALDARYGKQLADTASGPGKAYTFVASLDNVKFQLLPLVQAAVTRPESLARPIFLSTRAPVDAYKAEAIGSGSSSSHMLGYFFYVAGSFRIIDELVFASLSGARTSPRLPYISAFEAQMMLLQSVQPVLPLQPRPAGISNTVMLEIVIDVIGQVQSAAVLSGDPVLGEAARAAVMSWRYRPYIQNGHAVPVETTVTIMFPL